MAKNYNPWMLLVILLISINFSFSQTVTFTGSPSDFLPSQKITGDATVDYYVSFDEVTKTMYFGAFRTSGTFASDHYLTIYFDADPQPTLASGEGSTTGVRQHERTPILPFTANDRFVIANILAGEKTLHHRRGGRSWGVITPTEQVIQHTSPSALEIAIKISKLDISSIPTKGIYYSMFMASNTGFYGYNDSSYPIKFSGNNSTGYFGGIGVTSKINNPTAHQNTPILHSIINPSSALPSGVKYAYMEFVDNEYIYDTENIEIVPGGTLLIGPDGTLIIDNLINNGLVFFSSNSTQYSGLIANTVGGSGTAQYQRHVNAAGSGTTGKNDLISTPLAGQTFGSFAADNDNLLSHPTISTQKGFGPFNKSTATYQNYDTVINENTLLESGVGYRAGSKTEGALTGGAFLFTGTVNTSNVSVPLSHTSDDYGRWNLIGNPYPSYIDMYELIQFNTPQFDESENYDGIYAYNGNPTNSNISGEIWEVHNLATTSDPQGRRDMAPGQGFYVSSKTGGGSFTFTTTSRTSGYGDDFIEFRAAAPTENASLRLTITNNSNTSHTDIYFNNAGTLDHDRGYDSAQIGNPSFTIFSKLVEDSTNRDVPLVIQTLPYSILNSEVSVPIGIKASQGEQVTIRAINTPAPLPLPESVEVYFEDKVAQTSTRLNTSTLPHNDYYVFTPSTNLTGTMGRFFLRFTNKSLGINTPDFDALNVYSPLNTGTLIVKGSVNEVTNLDIFDLNGRLVQTFFIEPYQAENRFDVSKLTTGIYIVKLHNKTQSKIKKIHLNNKL
jgi:hypothetical protein